MAAILSRPQCVNSLTLEDVEVLSQNTCYFHEELLWNCSQVNTQKIHIWEVYIGSGNGLESSGNKPLPEPILTQINVASLIWWEYDLPKMEDW